MSRQTSGEAKTSSASEEETRQYAIPALHPPSRGQYSSTAHDDDESNQFFMSEPSLSELDDSSGRIQAPHRLLGPQPFRRVSTSESEGPELIGMGSPQLVPPFARQSPVQTSPGNTSLSSWDSPATLHKVQLQFATPPKQRAKVHVEKSANGSAVVKLQPNVQSESMESLLPVMDTSSNGHKQQTSSGDDNAPPLVPNISAPRPKVDRTPSNSTSSASAGQLASIDDFLQDLRKQSAGALEESLPLNTSMDDSFPYGRTDRAGIDSVMRTNGPAQPNAQVQQSRQEPDPSSLPTSIHEMSTHTRDDSMALSLSDSENEDTTLDQTNHSSDLPLDWEAQHSADDEKTAERPPRVRAYSSSGKPAPGHRRTRSGDQVAATLVTGGSDWKGMGRDKIPLPEGDDDDEDDTVKDLEAGRPGHRRTRSGDEAAASLVTGGPDWKGMGRDKVLLPEEVAEEEDEGGDSDHAVRQPPKQPKAEESKESQGIGQEEIEKAVLLANRHVDGPYQSQSHGSLRPSQAGSRVDHAGHWNSTYRQQPHVHDSRQSPMQRMPEPPHLVLSDSPAYSQRAEPRGSVSSSYSRDSPAMSASSPSRYTQTSEQTQTAGVSEGAGEDRNEVLVSSTSEEESDLPVTVQQNRIQVEQQEDFFDLEDAERRLEDRGFRGTSQNVMRPHRTSPRTHSPFANIGKKSAEKAPRHAFFPVASILAHDPDKYPTYICPRCKTRQREFFGVSDAPRDIGQGEGPSGYLALYFFIYVSASLFIFGLEEGWMPLDCIYFAVVTLTTSGLGDFVPTTDANKVICSIFIYFGVACIGLLLGSYIAGMLDDRAFRDARKKQMESCPNCARIQTMKEAAANTKLPEQSPYAAPVPAVPRRGLQRFMSERHVDQRDHCAIYVSPHHHSDHRKTSSFASEHSSERSQDGVEFGGPQMTPTQNFRHGTVQERMDTASHSTIGSQQSAQSYKSQSNVLGSPVTRQILGRQSHTRHQSIDITNGGNVFGEQSAYRRTRKYSEDLPSFQTPPTIAEGAPLESNSAPSAPLYPDQNQGYGATEDVFHSADSDSDTDSYWDSEDDDENSPTSSSSSGSSTEVLLDERALKIRTAKYVLLTLRQALVNSMVIIAVGCMGFWFIEGFSLVDSWYFTTVFLTTVGYGDIVPVTKGGKLFATVYLLVAGTILINNMSLISMIPLELRKRRIERAVLTQFGDQLDDAALRELATGPVIQRLRLTANRPDGLDECTREMFALAMLVRLGKVSEDDIRETFAAFRRLDVNEEGLLNSKSIIMGMYKKVRSEAEKLRESSLMPPPPPLTAVGISQSGPPYYLAPQQQQGVQKVGEEREDLQNYWFGGRGSLHVATSQHHYRFDPQVADAANEQAALLQRQESPGFESSDSDAYSAYGRSMLHRQESSF